MENRVNSGAIFKNNFKEKETQPDYKGTINVEGKNLEISLWIKEGQKGKFFSASVKEPYNKEEKKPIQVNNLDDLPF